MREGKDIALVALRYTEADTFHYVQINASGSDFHLPLTEPSCLRDNVLEGYIINAATSSQPSHPVHSTLLIVLYM